jgi:pimeloyl-ACP methyl ester carboxylesterase
MSFWTAMLGGQVRYIEIGPVRMRILEAGDAESERTLLLLHGSGGHAENWLENVIPLSVAGHVIAPDLLGHGWNSRPKGITYNYRAVLDNVIELIQTLGVGPVDILGMSLGATIGARVAAEHPELVRTLTMLCPPALHPKGDETMNRNTAGARELFANPTPEGVRERFVNMLHRPEVIAPDFIAARVEMQKMPEAADTILPILEDFNTNWSEYDINPQVLAQIECPSLFVWGRYNHPGPDVAIQAASQMKNAEVLVMEESGHWPHLEEKLDFESAATAFLARN